jgi:CHAP domain
MDARWRQWLTRLGCMLLAGAMSGCAGGPRAGPNLAAASHHPGLTCAPFARELSGIALYGDAADWWDAADRRYAHGSRPVSGSVLVFRRSTRLPSGHVSVVSRLLAPRRILVIQANWSPGELDEDQLVLDVSERNDWTAVRVWWPPTNQIGSHEYATYGFIIPPQPATHDRLARAASVAASLAVAERSLRR